METFIKWWPRVIAFISGYILGSYIMDFWLTRVLKIPTTLGDWAYIAEIITGFSIIIAIIEYYSHQEKDKKIAVADQVHMLRTEVIDGYEKAFRSIIPALKIKMLVFPRPIPIVEEFSYSWVIENYEDITQEQNFILRELMKNDIYWGHKEINSYLNVLEELAIRIKITGTVNDPTLGAIKQTFVSSVELFLIKILEMISNNDSYYRNIRWLYSKWYKDEDVDRSLLEVRQKKINDSIEDGVRKKREKLSK